MKKLINLITITALLVTSFAFAEKEEHCCCCCDTENSFGYVDIGLGPFPFPVPSFGLGYRTQNNHHGKDLSLQVSTVIAVTQVKASALYHYYFKPNLYSQFYVGAGASASGIFASHRDINSHFFISPEFAFGKEYKNETCDTRFFEAAISFPTFGMHDFPRHTLYAPLVVLKYGIAF